MTTERLTEHGTFRDLILDEYKKGNIVFATADGIMGAPLKDFVEQPVNGLLYDLNRDEATVLTFIEDRKWINDYAVACVIRELKRQLFAAQEVAAIEMPTEKECLKESVKRFTSNTGYFNQSMATGFVRGTKYFRSRMEGKDK